MGNDRRIVPLHRLLVGSDPAAIEEVGRVERARPLLQFLNQLDFLPPRLGRHPVTQRQEIDREVTGI
jgi:hypothetical protein